MLGSNHGHGKIRDMPREQVEIHLRYEGPDVDDGAMSVEQVVPVLQGFAGAYGKLAGEEDTQSRHQLKITNVRQGSADIVLQVFTDGIENVADLIAGMGPSIASDAAFRIVEKILKVVNLKRHVKRRPYTDRIGEDGKIEINNAENVTVLVTPEIHEIFKRGTLDRNLSRLASPLEEGRINAAEIEVNSKEEDALRERITAQERQYFECDDEEVASTRETSLIATLNSLTKSTGSGFLHLADGKRVFYKYVGENPEKMHEVFGTHGGSVRIQCVAKLDENLNPLALDVTDIERLQRGLFED